MFQVCIRKAAAAARPVNSSGVAVTRVALIAPLAKNPRSSNRAQVAIGSCPVRNRMTLDRTAAPMSDPRGTATTSQRASVRRRSIRITRASPYCLLACLLCRPRHHEAELLHVGVLTLDDASDAPVVEHSDTIRQRQDLVEVFADEQDADTPFGRLQEESAHVVGGADVQPAGRRVGHQDQWPAGELPGEQDLLDVAAGELTRRRLRRGRADVEPLHEFFRVCLDPPWMQHAARRDWRSPIGLEDQGVRDGERGSHPRPPSIIGHIGDAPLNPLQPGAPPPPPALRRRTVTRFETAMTSSNLCEMKMTARCSPAINRRVWNRSSASWGVSCEVGSSRIRTLAPRYSALRISTRCCSPTDSCQIRARGVTGIRDRCARSAIRPSTTRGSNKSPRSAASRCPSTRFSATVKEPASRKCWWTIPMPASIASRGAWNATGSP